MKISIKITKSSVENLHAILQNINMVHPVTRDDKTNKSILEEVAQKVQQTHHNFTGKKLKKINLKYHQASVLEYFLRGVLKSPLLDKTQYHFLYKIANDLHQELA
ncbi:hypothetical protein [Capnocytophaga stomatis]|uniref:hypothetical protein n=1 Tax=Capnocytophaga stomatis TaxID=1848904 RepID=UPI001AC7E275|nr:hypothetical protein [Capnocytophaga stomatis]GIM49433.1 hypothetical protein CAPN003_08850 [Capnocytophaga stomatis]